jgi:serine/threonine protein phosphatase PrpC
MDDRNATWDHGLDYAVLTDIGLRRTNNQDSYAAVVASSEPVWRQRGHLFVVADGMGAHAAGELASKLAVDNISHLYHKLGDQPPAEAIRRAIEQANDEIHHRGKVNLDFKGMGTTSSCLILAPEGAVVAHVGDSRVYRLRGNRLEQLTFDHSLVWEMMASGQLRDNEMANSFPKNIITRSLGPNPQVQVDVEGPFPLAVGDTFLLCSDGLTGPVQNEEMAIILSVLPPKEAAQALVDLANLRGGPDNITVEVARLVGPHIIERAGAGKSAVESFTGSRIGSAGWVWILVGVSVAAAAGLVAAGIQWPAGPWKPLALVPAALAGILFLFAILRRRPAARPTDAVRMGRAPYASCAAAPNAAFVEQLAKVFQQLKDAATNADWTVDWSKIIAFERQAGQAAEARNYPAAIKEYCHAISFMMKELREQQKRKRGASRPEEELQS